MSRSDFFTSGDNPRVRLEGDHYERIFQILEAEVGDPVGEVVEFLRESTPVGNHWDTLGASVKQLDYIAGIAGFYQEDLDELIDVLGESGGVSMAQAGHLIDSLKPYMKDKRELQGLMNPQIDHSMMKCTEALTLLAIYDLGVEGEVVLTSDLVNYVVDYGAVNGRGTGPLRSLGNLLLSLREQGLIIHNKTVPPSKAKNDPGQKSSAALAPGVLEMIETEDTLEELRIRAEETRCRRSLI